MSYRGSCLCGSIDYTIEGEIGSLSICHCNKCQKANGSAFLAGVTIDPDGFKINDPKGYLKSYQSSPEVLRYFCGNCASPIYSLRPYANPIVMRLRVGTLDTPLATQPAVHIFYVDKVPWYDGTDNAPKHIAGLDSPSCDF